MLGLPLDLLLGVQNDGDSPEVMGEDREYPILRMQPKVHFDVDLYVVDSVHPTDPTDPIHPADPLYL
jgi:hypothetical protein